jgi:hypothetical protein|tara:strand:+ start:3275 stop:3652 length:378 start_codon:yes stop_codon:yes gene_type:complete
MSFTTQTLASPLATSFAKDTVSNLTVETAASSGTNIYFVEVANPNSTTAAYVKIFAAASGSAITGQHVLQLYCASNTTCYYYIPTSLAITTGLQFYVSTTPGISANDNTLVAPGTAVTVRIGTGA